MPAFMKTTSSPSCRSGCIRIHIPPAKGSPLIALLALSLFTSCAKGGGDESEEKFARQREAMVREQLRSSSRNIRDEKVLRAMTAVPRHEFVPANVRAHAYDDGPLPIGHGQTISQPYIVAFMTEKLKPKPADRVLEIGTGSGYQAAVLAGLVKDVYTIEIIEALGKQAETTLQRLGYSNVHVRIGDGYQGWPEAAPFDAVIVTCAPDHVPQRLVDQLKEGGRMIIPVGEGLFQDLYLLEKRQGRVEKQAVLPVRFVPMIPGQGKGPETKR